MKDIYLIYSDRLYRVPTQDIVVVNYYLKFESNDKIKINLAFEKQF